MGNPHDFREVMKAAFGFIDRTPDEVLAEQKARDERPSKGRGSVAPSGNAKPRQSEIDKMNEILAAAKPKPVVTTE